MKIAAVLLAAGASTRFGADNKLLTPFEGRPLIRHVAEILAGAQLAEIVLVAGADSAAIAAALDGLAIKAVANPRFAEGMGSSISAGIAALSSDPDGVFVVPGDMPRISRHLLALLMDVFRDTCGTRAVFPMLGNGAQSPPVLWPRATLADLAQLAGPHGGKQLLARLGGVSVPVDDDSLLADIDTPADLARLRDRRGR